MDTRDDLSVDELKQLVEQNISQEKGVDVMSLAEKPIQEGMEKDNVQMLAAPATQDCSEL